MGVMQQMLALDQGSVVGHHHLLAMQVCRRHHRSNTDEQQALPTITQCCSILTPPASFLTVLCMQ
jgi:hypothetical protein